MSNSLFCVQPSSRKIFLATLRYVTVLSSLSFLHKRAGACSIHTPSFRSSYSCFAAHFFQYTDRAPLHQHFFNVSWAHKPHVNSCLIAENQCVPMRPFSTQITGLTHHCPCRFSHLSPHLNCLNFASSTLFFVHAAIFRVQTPPAQC